jgi:hypothetical protein
MSSAIEVTKEYTAVKLHVNWQGQPWPTSLFLATGSDLPIFEPWDGLTKYY